MTTQTEAERLAETLDREEEEERKRLEEERRRLRERNRLEIVPPEKIQPTERTNGAGSITQAERAGALAEEAAPGPITQAERTGALAEEQLPRRETVTEEDRRLFADLGTAASVVFRDRFEEPLDFESQVGTVEGLLSQLEGDDQFFFERLREVGRTPEAVSLLEALYGWTPERIEEFYARVPDALTLLEETAARVFPRQKAEDVLDLAETDVAGFVAEIRKGPFTEDKRALLSQMGFSAEEIAQVRRFQQIVVPLDGIRKLVTIDVERSEARDSQGQRVGTYNVVTREFTSLPEESRWKDTWDAFRLAAAGAWNQTEGFFLSTVPNLLFRDLGSLERRLYGDDWVDRTNRGNRLLRDRFRVRYAQNQREFEAWVEKRPDILPVRQDYEEGALQHPALLKDPFYWAYETASMAPYMVASASVGLAAGVATGGNPLAIIAAAGAVQLPSQTEQVKQDLLANGMPEDRADAVALAAGALIASLEGLGMLPLLKVGIPGLSRVFHREASREIARLTMAQAARRGIQTFGAVQFAETLTEVLQQAVQNAAVKVADENRSIFEGLPDVAVKTFVATAPLALLGGGASYVRVPPSQVSGQTDAQLEAKGLLKEEGNWYERAEPEIKIPSLVARGALAVAQRVEGAVGRPILPATRAAVARRPAGAMIRGPAAQDLRDVDAQVKKLNEALRAAKRAGAPTREIEASLDDMRLTRRNMLESVLPPEEFQRLKELEPQLEEARASVQALRELRSPAPKFGTEERVAYDERRRLLREAGQRVVPKATALREAQGKLDRLRREYQDITALEAEEIPVQMAPRTAMQTGLGIGERPPQTEMLAEFQGKGLSAKQMAAEEEARLLEAERLKPLPGQTQMFPTRAAPSEPVAPRVMEAKPRPGAAEANLEEVIPVAPEATAAAAILEPGPVAAGLPPGAVGELPPSAPPPLPSPPPVPPLAQVASLQAQIARLRTRAATIAEQKQALTDYIRSNVPIAARGKLLVAVKNVATPAQLDLAIAQADAVTETFNQRGLRGQVRQELKKAAPTKVGGILRGKFTADTQRQLDAIAAVIDLDRDDARGRIADNVDRADAGDMDFQEMEEANDLLASAGIDGMTSDELRATLENIQSIKETGRSLRSEKREAEKVRLDAQRGAVIGVVTGGRGVKPGRVSVPAGELEETKGFLERLVNAQYSWDNLLDKLSKFHRSEPFRSPLSLFGNAVHVARDRENLGNEAAAVQVRAGLAEVFGTTNMRVLNQAMNHIQRDLVDVGTFVNAQGVEVRLRLTKGQIIAKYMQLQDPTLETTFTEGMAWTTEMKSAMGTALSPQEKALGDWMLQFYRDYYDGINAVYREIYGVDLSRNPFYSPIWRELGLTRDAQGKDVFEVVMLLREGARYASTLNRSLKSRVTNQRPLRFNDAFGLLINHVQQMEHFKAWAATMRDMRSVLGNAEVRTAIRQYHGAPILETLDTYMDQMARGGLDQAQVSHTLDTLRRNFTVAVLGLKPRIAIQQVPSVAAYMTQMPIGDFFMGVADYWKNPIANYRFLIEHSPFMRARFTQGFERDVRFALRQGPIQQVMGTGSMPQKFLWQIRQGDKLAVTQGMWAAYQSGLKRGLSTEEAITEAEQASRRSQDTSEIETLSSLQNGPSWQKLLTMFQNQPNKYFRLVADNARNIQYGRGRRDKALLNIMLAWVVLPAIFQLIADGFEFKTGRQLRAWALGPLNQVLIFGQMAQSLYGWLSDEPYDFQVSPVFATIRDLQTGLAKALKVSRQIDNPYLNLSVDDLVDAVEFFAKVGGQLTGIPTPYAVQVERAIRAGEPRELVFSRYNLRSPGGSDRARTEDLGRSLGATILSRQLRDEDPEVRKAAREAAQKRREDVEAGLTVEPEPLLDMARLDTEFRRILGDTLPEEVAGDKKFSALARSWAEMRQAQDVANLLPNRPLSQINTVLDVDDTILQYRLQWQAREGITNLADLREFDRVWPLARLGNVTNAQFALLKRYKDAKDKDAFLELHPELKVNPLTDWLEANPIENARLALWGNATLRSQAAYEEFIRLVKVLDIPEEVLPSMTLPPKESVKTHFAYLAAVEERSAGSWEAQLLLGKDPRYREWRELKPPETPIAALELLVKDRALYDQEQGLRDTLDGEELKKAVASLRTANPVWVDNQRRVEAFKQGTDEVPTADAVVKEWVERGRLVDKHTAGAAEVKVWLADHQDTYEWALEKGLLTDKGGLPGGDWNIPSLRITLQYRAEDKQYDETIPLRFGHILNKEQRDASIVDAREKYLASRPEYRKDRRRRDAYDLGLFGSLVEEHVAYHELSEKGFRRDRWLRDHKRYYETVWLNPDRLKNSAVDFAKIPDAKFDDLYEKWQPQMERYYVEIPQETRLLTGEERDKERARQRASLFARNPGFFEARIRYEAYGELVPTPAIEGYVAYYSVLSRGKPKEWEQWWADDRVLRDNPVFYAYALKTWNWEPRDFRAVPSVGFEKAYNEVYIRLRLPDGTADARARSKMRGDNRNFDLEGVRAGLWKPHENRTPQDRSEIADFVRKFA